MTDLGMNVRETSREMDVRVVFTESWPLKIAGKGQEAGGPKKEQEDPSALWMLRPLDV